MVHPLTTAIRVVEEFRKLDPELPTQIALTLLLIARKEGISLKEIGELTGQSRSSVSRNVAWLAQGINPKEKKGAGLIEYFEDPDDRRNKVCRLTPAGRRYINSIEAIIGG